MQLLKSVAQPKLHSILHNIMLSIVQKSCFVCKNCYWLLMYQQ